MVKFLVILFLAVAVFGAAGYFIYELFVKPDQLLKEELKTDGQTIRTPPPDPSLGDYKKALAVKESGDLVAAREAYRQFLSAWPKTSLQDKVMDELGQINTDIFFSRYEAPEKQKYEVKRGDALVKIASKMKTSAELIMRSNNLDGILINIGDVLLIPPLDPSIVINQKEKTVTLFNHGEFFKRYRTMKWDVPGKPQAVGARAKVTEAIAWNNGERVAFGSKQYVGSTRWVMTSLASVTLYSDVGSEDGRKVEKPPTGIGIAESEMEELAALVRRGTPIQFE